ncbi:MAG: ATP-binding cassette domain-containing protein [Verrucomicrobiales bacterium]|nr:ATP-binding cassette domain-containing protein [Verrucomicrobiales bacterium]
MSSDSSTFIETESLETKRPCAQESESKCFFEVKDLKKAIGGQKILRGVDLNIRRGETMVVIGRSGEGKSVFLKHLIGLMSPDAGSIKVEGQELVGLRERQMRDIRRKVGILFQDGALFDSMTVAENVAFPLMEMGIKNREELLERVGQALDKVELAEHMAKMPINISGGMRKRVSLARAIIGEPQCILYDEPTSGLDPVVSESIDRLILRMQKNLCVTSLVVTHDMNSVFRIADRVAYLREGKIHFLGTPEELRDSQDRYVRSFVEGRQVEEE